MICGLELKAIVREVKVLVVALVVVGNEEVDNVKKSLLNLLVCGTFEFAGGLAEQGRSTSMALFPPASAP
ncbi:hypothetical protein Leryth_024778 [Lithospermum erythrorhizon]|nr:hypothetical protein Leryth_024778 [Lithospermum erythrorhizon]